MASKKFSISTYRLSSPMTMSDVPDVQDIPLCQPETLTRTFLKCHRCRKDGKKCLPATGTVKCLRCTRLGHTCGPRERAASIRRRSSGKCSKTVAEHDMADFGESNILPAQTRSIDGELSQDSDVDLVLDQLHELFVVQLIVSRCLCELAPLLRRLTDDSALLRQHQILVDMGTKFSMRYRELAKLTSSQIDAQLNDSQRFQCETLKLKFKLLQSLNLGFFKLGTSEVHEDYAHLLSFDAHPLAIPKQGEYIACTSQILSAIDLVKLRVGECAFLASGLEPQQYVAAQEQIQSILQKVFAPQTLNPENVIFGETEGIDADSASKPYFPAAHLAYWNNDPEAAFRLMTNNGGLDLSTNLFNQNLLHLAVKAQDIGFLKRLVNLDPSLTRASITGAGYSPLVLAIILDDFDIFGLLIGRCMGPISDSAHLVNFAVSAQSHNIIDSILERQRILLPPYTQAAAYAIDQGSEDIALKFLPWLGHPYVSPAEWQDLMSKAERAGLFRLAAGLREPSSLVTSLNEALRSLQTHLQLLED